MKLLQVVFVGIFINGLACSPADRLGYHHVADEGSWLGLHQVPATFQEARLRCHIEGGQLASPTSDALATSMKSMMDTQELAFGHVFTGIHDTMTKGYYSALDGTPLSLILLPWAAGEPNNFNDAEDCLAMTGAGELADVSCNTTLPYFCQKRDDKMKINECGTAAEGYELNQRTSSCYKFHRIPKSWFQASEICAAEGAHLAVINSEKESKELATLFQNNHSGLKTKHNNLAYIGIRYWVESGEWMTIFDETLEEAGFSMWNDNEPNNASGDEYCGSLVVGNGQFNDVPCRGRGMTFICEIVP